MTSYRRISPDEIGFLSEIDRSERVTQTCTVEEGRLRWHDDTFDIPNWTFRDKLREWEPIADGFRNAWGAFREGRPVGFAVYRRDLSPGTAQLSILHVDRGFRSIGIGNSLLEIVRKKAVEDGKGILYVTSTPTGNTVRFYLSRGFVLTSNPDPVLLRMEPDDIHMIMKLTTG